MGVWIATASLALSVGALAYQLRRHEALDPASARVRWVGAAICLTLSVILFAVFKVLGFAWVHSHVGIFIAAMAVPIYLFLFFVFSAGISRWLAGQLGLRA